MPYLPFQLVATVERRADAVPLLTAAGQGVLVHRGYERLIVIRCPSGCGEDIVVNLDRNAGPAWRLYRTPRGVTLYPSIWRDSGCESHFILWDDQILLFDGRTYSWDARRVDIDEKRVLAAIESFPNPVGFRDVADQMQEIPWVVLAACRRLVGTRALVEVEDGVYRVASSEPRK